eukprot:TRINITY_DN54010_c0_g1_i1.p1 TRINITY_DN54010_c0_g1~~TRINITY_DN54010_c0_g1_i1.p1  ORF type:complete len:351 (+),score=36.63 TRINITY_DN54010_c0_g1_i1:89-1054(+)
MSPSGDALIAEDDWQPISEEHGRKIEYLFSMYDATTIGKECRFDIDDTSKVDFRLMTQSKLSAKGKYIIFPIRRRDGQSGKQTHPPPGQKHPWFEKRVALQEMRAPDDRLTKERFWEAFCECLERGGFYVDPSLQPESLFDFQHNRDYRNWAGPDSEIRGGIRYYVPIGWKKFAVRVKKRYGEDKSWLRLDGGPGEWAVAYHGTSSQALAPIIAGSLKVGSAQVCKDQRDIRTGELIGTGIYCTPSTQVAQNYADMRSGCSCGGDDKLRFVLQCRVRPGAIKRVHDEETNPHAYWLVNDPADIRPYGVLVQDRDADACCLA